MQFLNVHKYKRLYLLKKFFITSFFNFFNFIFNLYFSFIYVLFLPNFFIVTYCTHLRPFVVYESFYSFPFLALFYWAFEKFIVICTFVSFYFYLLLTLLEAEVAKLFHWIFSTSLWLPFIAILAFALKLFFFFVFASIAQASSFFVQVLVPLLELFLLAFSALVSLLFLLFSFLI